MCWAEKFFFCVPLNLGCVLVGIVNTIVSITMMVVSILHFTIGIGQRIQGSFGGAKLMVYGIELHQMAIDIISGLSVVLALCWILVCLLLIIGITRNKPSYILAYFIYGVVMVIFCQLGSLLIGLQGCWVVPLILFMISLLYIHILVAVYTVYELMQRGKDFSFHMDDASSLLTDLDY